MPRTSIILLISGFVLSLLSTLAGGVKLYNLDLYLNNIAFVTIAALFPLARQKNPLATIWWLSIGAAFHGLVYQSLKQQEDVSTWSVAMLSLVLLLFYIAINYLVKVSFRAHYKAQSMDYDFKSVGVLALVTALTIISFRVFDVLMVEIPNEQRSIMLFGVEFHHINLGIMLLLALDMLGYARQRGKYLVAVIASGIGLGTLIDQSVYFSLAQISDESYRGVTSLWGAVIVYLFSTAIWYWRATRRV